MRAPDNCPHRTRHGPSGTDRCGVLGELIGAEDGRWSSVEDYQCEGCCRYFEPSSEDLNPYLASLVFEAATQIIGAEGVEGCSLEKATALKERARGNLRVINFQPTEVPPNRAYEGNCMFLGDLCGERPCSTCQGTVRRKVFGCAHPLHSNTTIWDCQRCPDYDPALTGPSGGEFSWAVGVTAAPRAQPTLQRSLSSLGKAGWTHPLLFVEPETTVPPDYPPERTVRRTTTLGAWPNFLLSLIELMMREPRAHAYLLCQDDVLYCAGLRHYLEETLWPAEKVGVVSLHTPSHHDRGDVDGFYVDEKGWAAWGAQAYVFPNASARALVAHSRVVNHRHRGPRDGLRNVDSVVGQWCRDSGFPYVLHTPSLTQHIGETSTLWENATVAGRRRAATFVGEEVEITELMAGESERSGAPSAT